MLNIFKKRRPKDAGWWDGLIKVRGRSSRKLAQVNDRSMIPNLPTREYVPRGLNRQMAGSTGSTQWSSQFDYAGSNRGDFYRWLRDRIPIIQSAVWTWVRLCATQMEQVIEGNASDRAKAIGILAKLDRRALESPYGKGSSIEKLTEGMFLELFTTGKMAGEAVLTEDGKAVDHFRLIDPYRVEWEHNEHGWTPFVHDDDDGREQIDPERFFYATIGTDLTNPAGVEPLASIPFVAEIEQLMLEDMARSSHNAGTPRLQIKVSRPERFNWEGDRDFAERANTYFRDVVSEFGNLEPDDNIFTWSDVEVTMIGQSGVSSQWRLGREQVIEDVITGLRLFPWVLGRTHMTARNWVQSQFNLLMEMVRVHQKTGADLVDWLCNLELGLQGVNAVVRHRFRNHPDPFRLDRARAESLEAQTVDFKVQQGYINADEGAHELGYVKATGKRE